MWEEQNRKKTEKNGIFSKQENSVAAASAFQSSPFSPYSEHYSFSSRSSTSAVVYHSVDCSRRSNSSSLTSGEMGSHSDISTCGMKRPSTRPLGSHSSTSC